jgi:hypothetical protein
MVKEEDICKFHEAEWLPCDLVCSTTSLNFPAIDHMHIVCLESHLICGLGLLPSKFLISILSFLGCEQIHLQQKAIATLSYYILDVV